MEDKASDTSKVAPGEHTPSKPWLLSSVFTWLVITALYIKEQMESDSFDSQKSFYPALLLIPAVLFMVAKKNSAPPTKPKTIPAISEISTPLLANHDTATSATLSDEINIIDSSESKLLTPSPAPNSDNATLSVTPIDSATDIESANLDESKPRAPDSLTHLERLCKALQDGADLLPSIFLVQSCISLVQNIMAETKNNELYTFTVIAGLATGALVEISLGAVKTFKIGLISDIENDLPEKRKIYISVDGNFKYTLKDDHGEVHENIEIPIEELNPSQLPDAKYPILLRAALKEHLPTILKITSKNGHTPNDPKFRRNLEELFSHTRNHVLLALQFVLSTMMARRLPAVKGAFDAIASSVFTGFNWSRFMQNLSIKAIDSFPDSPKKTRTPAPSIVDRPEQMPIPRFICPPWVVDMMRALLGAGCIGSSFYLKHQEFSDPERLMEWGAYWLNSVGGYFFGSGLGGPLARYINAHTPNHKNLFTTLSNYLIVFLISPNLNSFQESIIYTGFLSLAGALCRITHEISQDQLNSQLFKRAVRKDQIQKLFEKHKHDQHMQHLFDVLETPDGQLVLKQHKKQYLTWKRHAFNLTFFLYMAYKIASIPQEWQKNDRQNAWIDMLTAFDIAAMLFSFNFVLPKIRPAKDSIDFLHSWSWKKFIFDPNFALVFMSNVAFKIQYNPIFADHMSLVVNTALSNPMILLLVGKAADVYEIQVGGLEKFNTEDISALQERLSTGYGKINKALAQYFIETYAPQLKALHADPTNNTEKKHPKRNASPSDPENPVAPLLGKNGVFKNSSSTQELQQVAADTSNVVYDETIPQDPHPSFSQSALSGIIRGPGVSGNFEQP